MTHASLGLITKLIHTFISHPKMNIHDEISSSYTNSRDSTYDSIYFHFHSLGAVFFACQLHDNITSPSPVVQVPCDQRRNLLSLSRQQLQVMFDILATNSNQIFDLHITFN